MHNTYVMGRNAVFFDLELLENLKSQMSIWWKMSWRYHSNWRNLHIDGFEGCDADGKRSGIPSHGLVKYQFFQYAAKEPRCLIS
jgi:hypothetical protein